MRQISHNTAKLPKQLLDELGIDRQYGGIRGRPGGPGARREHRKAARVQKKQKHTGSSQRYNHQRQSRELESHDDNKFTPDLDGARNLTATKQVTNSNTMPRSILKTPKSLEPVGATPGIVDSTSSSSPPRLSRIVKHRLAEEDAKIEALERALGIVGKKQLPKSFMDDGLDSLLDGLDEFQSEGEPPPPKRNRTQGDENLKTKRRNLSGSKVANNDLSVKLEGLGRESLSSDGSGSDESAESDRSLDDDGTSDQDSFEGFDMDPSTANSTTPRIRENPYAAPSMPQDTHTTAKYVPPSQRVPIASEEEDLQRLRRQIQGLLNRLSEANLIPILNGFEKLYRDHPRQHVSSTLQELLLSLLCDPTSLQDTFVVLHAGFIAGVYKLIGTDFGAHLVQRIVEDFDSIYTSKEDREANGKKLTNLISLLAELYNFQVIGSGLIYDFIRMFLKDFSENNTELLLKVIRNSGQQLRQDDPLSLGEIVQLLHSATAPLGMDNLSVRTKFMMETINSLKNNRMKTGVTSSIIASEHRTRMKKLLGSLSTRKLKASEPLRIKLAEIRDTQKRGKWWLVGASYKDEDTTADPDSLLQSILGTSPDHTEANSMEIGSTDLLQLAKEHRMNTDVRRSIFITIMSATDYRDAHLRLLKLRLARTQEHDIPKVLIYCSNIERTYNPYYTLVARQLCTDKKHKKAFQFSLLDEFRRMGEDRDDDGEDKDSLGIHEVVNLAKMFGRLVAEGRLELSILKTLNLAYLQSKTQMFVELFLITVIVDSQQKSPSGRDEKALMDIFLRLGDIPELSEGLQYFLKEVVSNTDVAGSERNRKTVKWGSKVAVDALGVLRSAERPGL